MVWSRVEISPIRSLPRTRIWPLEDFQVDAHFSSLVTSYFRESGGLITHFRPPTYCDFCLHGVLADGFWNLQDCRTQFATDSTRRFPLPLFNASLSGIS
jgi:hypothetical protein